MLGSGDGPAEKFTPTSLTLLKLSKKSIWILDYRLVIYIQKRTAGQNAPETNTHVLILGMSVQLYHNFCRLTGQTETVNVIPLTYTDTILRRITDWSTV